MYMLSLDNYQNLDSAVVLSIKTLSKFHRSHQRTINSQIAIADCEEFGPPKEKTNHFWLEASRALNQSEVLAIMTFIFDFYILGCIDGELFFWLVEFHIIILLFSDE
ncbi:hypothetical protein BC833DRAFT_568918 [Globomyces pollinis-pini]|nr:hypothetical protein BC833DRAFT_568918 [Globomyces pollinis-pini]